MPEDNDTTTKRRKRDPELRAMEICLDLLEALPDRGARVRVFCYLLRRLGFDVVAGPETLPTIPSEPLPDSPFPIHASGNEGGS